MATAITQNSETQSKITPSIALEMLKTGNQRFLASDQLSRDFSSQIDATSGGQWPFACVLSCIDSRVPTEHVFDLGIGDIFNAKVAGNFVNGDILGSMEYACKVAGSCLIVVMGHTGCGAVKSACDDVRLGNITGLLSNILPAVADTTSESGEDRSSRNSAFVNRVSKTNVERTIENIRSGSDILRDMHDKGEIAIVGAMYDVGSGRVEFYQP